MNILMGIFTFISFLHPALACVPNQNGMEVGDLKLQLEQFERHLVHALPVLKKAADVSFRWTRLDINIGTEGDCSAKQISADTDIKYSKGTQNCHAKVSMDYHDFPKESYSIKSNSKFCL